jgi:hypothetical protein
MQFIDEDGDGGVGVRLRSGVKLPAVKKKR